MFIAGQVSQKHIKDLYANDLLRKCSLRETGEGRRDPDRHWERPVFVWTQTRGLGFYAQIACWLKEEEW